MEARELDVLKEAQAAAFGVDAAAQIAAIKNEPEAAELRSKADEAYQKVAQMRAELISDGDSTTAADLEEIKAIKAEIEQAATNQQVFDGVFKLASFTARFAA